MSSPTAAGPGETPSGRGLPRRDVGHSLRELYTHPGPYLSMYLDVSPGAGRDDGPNRLDTALDQLDEITQAQHDVAAGALEDLRAETGMLALLVAADGAATHLGLAEPPRVDVWRIDELPYVGPLFEGLQSQVHHLVVVVGERGVDVVRFPPQGEPIVETDALTDPGSVAAWVAALAETVDTDLVVITGHQPGVAALQDLLPDQLGPERAVSVATAPPPTTGEDRIESVADEIVRAVADHVASETVESLRLWRFHRAHGAATDGLVETTEALQQGRVGLLLVHDDPDDERYGWFGPGATDIAIDLEHRNASMREHESGRARLVDAMVRSAFLQGAGIRIIPSTGHTGPTDDIGAVIADRQSPAAWGAATSPV